MTEPSRSDDEPPDGTETGPANETSSDRPNSEGAGGESSDGGGVAHSTAAGDDQSPDADSLSVTPGESLETAAAGLSVEDVSAYTTDERSLSPSVQLIWAVRALIGVAILTAIAAFLARRFEVAFTFVAAGGVALAVLALVWVHLRHRVWVYRVREDSLYLRRGVVTQVDSVVPYVRIQHVDTQRGPMERALGLSTLVVYTAGSRGADVSIPGLQTDEAQDLQQRVKELAIDAEGGDAL